ncbi:MAG: helix-turn-helix domain-containing protein [Solirubrobacterales bacterium]
MVEPGPSGLEALIADLAGDPGWVPRTAGVVTDAIVAELPATAGDPDLLRALRDSVTANLRLMVEMLGSGVPASEAQPPPAATEYARELVRRGVSVDSLLRAYFIAHAAFFGYVREELPARISEPDALAATLDELMSWSFGFVQAISGGIVERYGAERERWVRSSAALKSELVDEILAGRVREVGPASAQLNYRLDRTHLAFVIWSEASGAMEDPAASERVAARFAARRGSESALLLPRGAGLVAGWLGSGATAAAIDPGAVEVDGLGGPDRIRLALGSPAPGIEGFRSSHHQAMQAHRVAMLGGADAGAVSAYRDVALPALASADPEHAARFCRQELGALLGDDGRNRRLRETVLTYLESASSPRRAAGRLGVHENTVVNHVRAAEEAIGHPLTERPGELIVALRLAPLVPPVPAGPAGPAGPAAER